MANRLIENGRALSLVGSVVLLLLVSQLSHPILLGLGIVIFLMVTVTIPTRVSFTHIPRHFAPLAGLLSIVVGFWVYSFPEYGLGFLAVFLFLGMMLLLLGYVSARRS